MEKVPERAQPSFMKRHIKEEEEVKAELVAYNREMTVMCL